MLADGENELFPEDLFLDVGNACDVEYEDDRGEGRTGKTDEESKKSKKKIVKNKTAPLISRPYFQPRQIYARGRGGRGDMKRFGNRRPVFNQLNTRPDLRKDMSMRRRERSRSNDDADRSGDTRRRLGHSRSRERRSKSKEVPLSSQDSQQGILDKQLINKGAVRDSSNEISLKSKERGNLAINEVARSKDEELRHREKRSKSREEDKPRGSNTKMGGVQSSKGRRSRSRDYFKNRGRRSRSRNRSNQSRNHGRRSRSRGRRSRSRERRAISRDRRSRSRGRRSRSRGRRSLSRGRRSRSRDKRSPTSKRRSKSRERHSSRDRHSRSRSIKRIGRRSKSDSRSRSSSRGRRRNASYSSEHKSSSSDIIVYKTRVDLVDVDQYEEETRRRDDFQQRSQHFSNTLISAPVSGQFSQTSTGASPPFHNTQFHSSLAPPPPGIGPYDQATPPFTPDQPPPAPFISSQTQSGPPRIIGGAQPSQQFISQPQHPRRSAPTGHVQQNPFPAMASNQPNEYDSYPQSMSGEFTTGFPNYNDTTVSSERYIRHMAQPTQLHPAPFNAHGSKDFNPNVRAKWNVTPQNQQTQSSSNLIYPGSGTAAHSSKQIPNKSGVEEERQNQKQTLVIQRDQYLQKRAKLQKDLTQLKSQRTDLLHDNLPETDRLLKENSKLQNEINQRLKAIENVIEMLTGLIKKDQPEENKRNAEKSSLYSLTPSSPLHYNSQEGLRSHSDKDSKRSSRTRNRSSSSEKSLPANKYCDSVPRRSEKTVDDSVIILETSPPPLILPKYSRDRRSPKSKDVKTTDPGKPVDAATIEPKLYGNPVVTNQSNIIYYDPELHWCSLCNIFPKTATDYLNHLHTSKHKQQVVALKLDPSPWHADESVEPPPPVIKNAPTKRIPIRGVQFLVPATGWYCRLCKTWIGDIHCSQEHLKGKKHTTNYTEYITQNPHWEVDWLSDRTKSFERSSEYLSRLREKEPSPDLTALSDTLLAVLAKQNKRQRLTSSSSSESSSSDSKDKKKQKKSRKKKSKRKKRKDSSPEKSSVKVEKSSHVPNYRQKENEDISQNSDVIANWMEPDKGDSNISIRLKSKLKQKEDQTSDDIHDCDWNTEVDDLAEENKGNEKFRDERESSDRNKGERSRNDAIRDDRGRFSLQRDDRDARLRTDSRGRTEDIGRNREHEKASNKFREEKGANRNWNNPRGDNVFRKDGRDVQDKASYNQREDSLQQKKLDHQKINIFSQQPEESLATERKKSPVRVFQRPDDSSDRDSPELVLFQEKRDKFSKSDKPQGKLWFPSKESNYEEMEETIIFEKLPEEKEIVPKKKVEAKKLTQFTISKAKLPFIGRMPLLKKKTVEQKPDEPIKEKSDPSGKSLTWPNIPNAEEGPHLPEISEPDKTSAINNIEIKDAPIIKQPVLTAERYKINEDNLAEQDMDIANDDQDDVIWVENQEKTELHPDFQDALDLLFPEEDKQNKKDDRPRENQYDHLIYGPAFDGHYGRDMCVNHSGYPGGHPLVTSIDTSGAVGGPPQIGNLGCPPPPIITGASHLGDSQIMLGPGVPPPMGPPPLAPGPPRMPNDGSLLMMPRGPPPTVAGDNPVMINPAMGPGVPPVPNRNDNVLAMGPPRQPMAPGIIPMGPPGTMASGIPPMGPPGTSLYTPEDSFVEELPPKRKNAPSQRMRRHLQKKRAKEEAEKVKAETSASVPADEKKMKYEGMDLSDLAMLGIDEDDSIIC